VVALCLVAALLPKVAELSPPFSESPSGLLVIFVRLEALGIVATAAIATLVASAISPNSGGLDAAA
jgi:hypothetical protein